MSEGCILASQHFHAKAQSLAAAGTGFAIPAGHYLGYHVSVDEYAVFVGVAAAGAVPNAFMVQLAFLDLLADGEMATDSHAGHLS